MSALIGIDWAKELHHACIVNEAGAQIARFSFPHSTQGFAKLERHIAKLNVPPPDCLVALETAHNLLIDFLWSRRFQIFVIPPVSSPPAVAVTEPPAPTMTPPTPSSSPTSSALADTASPPGNPTATWCAG